MKVGVLISGRGSNLQSLIDAQTADTLGAEIALVISNIPDVHGLTRADNAGIATQTIDHKNYTDRATFEDTLHTALIAAEVELVCLAGFMRLLTDGFVKRWHDRLINIHPSLLPAFKGLHIHERVLAAGVRFTGCTVHFVRPAMDDGPIIVQAVVPVLDGDDEEALAARVLAKEHEIYPLAVRLIAGGRVTVDGERAIVADAQGPEGGLHNPIG
jgi:phosphoribosylglycinamide formyltransferase-1